MAHDSAGPKTDIVLPGMGFLAKSAEEYALILQDILVILRKNVTKNSTLSINLLENILVIIQIH